jgi:signal transduction histidine kinase/ActR/RegA family two-component response regulator
MNRPDIPAVNISTFEDELLRFLARQGRRVPIPVFLLATVIWAMAIQQLSPVLPSFWLALVVLVLILRWVVLGKLPTLTSISTSVRLRIAVALGAISGISHGLSLGFFWAFPDFERAIQSMLLFALSAGAVGTTAGYRPLFIAYIIPTLLPLSILWAIQATTSSVWWIDATIALLIVFLGLVLIALARDNFRLFKDSFDIRLQQVELNAKLQLALEREEQANHSKTRFLASASHDLRQPMHTVTLFAATLAMRPLDERSREIVNHMNEAVEDLSSELDALLDISKLDAGVIEVQRETIAIKPFLRHLYEMFLPEANTKHLDLKIDCPDNLFTYTDKNLLERTVRNLLQNAIKYTSLGHVLVQVEVQRDSLLLVIADTGPGIHPEEHSRIFEEFYQIDNPERDRTRGLGLGLAIVKRLAHLLEMEISLESSPGIGSRFALTLPRVSMQKEEVTATPDTRSSFIGLHVLVVDDEAKVRLGMKALLEGMGCRVTDVDGTDQAVISARADPADIVLADFRLRGNDSGVATIRAIRAFCPSMPALLISGDTAPQRLREANAAGIILLHKPVSIKSLTGARSAEVPRRPQDIVSIERVLS